MMRATWFERVQKKATRGSGQELDKNREAAVPRHLDPPGVSTGPVVVRLSRSCQKSALRGETRCILLRDLRRRHFSFERLLQGSYSSAYRRSQKFVKNRKGRGCVRLGDSLLLLQKTAAVPSVQLNSSGKWGWEGLLRRRRWLPCTKQAAMRPCDGTV